jgi:DNA-binding beta-propeller fold protein YncE
MSLMFLAFTLVGMVMLTGTVSNNNMFTFNKSYAAPRLDGPGGIAVDSSGNVFVAEEFNNRVQKFTNTGEFIRKWGSFGSGDGQFEPSDVAVDSSGNVFVADGDNNRIQKFTNTGKFIRKWGSFGSASIAVTGANPSDENTSKQLTPFAFSIEK